MSLQQVFALALLLGPVLTTFTTLLLSLYCILTYTMSNAPCDDSSTPFVFCIPISHWLGMLAVIAVYAIAIIAAAYYHAMLALAILCGVPLLLLLTIILM